MLVWEVKIKHKKSFGKNKQIKIEKQKKNNNILIELIKIRSDEMTIFFALVMGFFQKKRFQILKRKINQTKSYENVRLVKSFSLL